ncbi:hypothetical protein QSI_1487 [Clostridioides difficile P28]|nr:hypothetical protein QSI_1487 [Clostridioides difficile P28]
MSKEKINSQRAFSFNMRIFYMIYSSHAIKAVHSILYHIMSFFQLYGVS